MILESNRYSGSGHPITTVRRGVHIDYPESCPVTPREFCDLNYDTCLKTRVTVLGVPVRTRDGQWVVPVYWNDNGQTYYATLGTLGSVPKEKRSGKDRRKGQRRNPCLKSRRMKCPFVGSRRCGPTDRREKFSFDRYVERRK